VKVNQVRYRFGCLIKKHEICLMATPIKITPILKNESSQRFNEMLVAQQNQKVSSEEKKRIESLVSKVLAKSKLK
jgi:hypothetical protein